MRIMNIYGRANTNLKKPVVRSRVTWTYFASTWVGL